MTNETEQPEVQKEEVSNDDIPSFDLPVVESASPATPRIHQAPGESACVSCEG